MSRTERRRKLRNTSPATLREVETNRLVRIMDSEDEALYRMLLQEAQTGDCLSGVVTGNPWGESGLVYAAGL